MVQPGPTELSPLGAEFWRRSAAALQDATSLHVALSGGLDSTVLLSLLHELRQAGLLLRPLAAIHVNHQLQAAAADWEAHCRRLCASLDVPLHVAHATVVAKDSGLGLEAAAREARYTLFADYLPQGALLLQGHHGEDQCETVLLHLARSSGVRGLAGIPAQRALGQGCLLRPLLSCARSGLQAHAQSRALQWVDDPSNSDTQLDRNYLRHEVLPLLKRRWPALVQNVARSSDLLAESSHLLDELAQIDLLAVRGASPGCLDVEGLRKLSQARCRNLLRYWVRERHGEAAGIPGRVLEEGLHTLLEAAVDRSPLLAWNSAAGRLELRRYRGELYLLDALPAGALEDLAWETAQALQLPAGLGILTLVADGNESVAAVRLEVRWRRGGEHMRLARRGTQSLKNLLQEQHIPPWWRPRLPLVYGAGELLVVPGLFESAHWPDFIGCRNARIVWQEQNYIEHPGGIC